MRHQTASVPQMKWQGFVTQGERRGARRRAALLTAWCTALACIDFGVQGWLPCPAHMSDCERCAPDGTCVRRVERNAPDSSGQQATDAGSEPAGKMPEDVSSVPASGGDREAPKLPPLPPVPTPSADAGPLQDASAPRPEPCALVEPLGSELCTSAEGPCFLDSLRDEIVLWLDPLSLGPPSASSPGYWCDRSGRGNHALHMPAQEAMALGDDPERAVPAQLRRSLVLDGNWLLLPDPDSALVFGADDFAVLIAAATPAPTDSSPPMYLFASESQEPDDINLVLQPPGEDVAVEGRVQLEQGYEVTMGPERSLYDGRYHLLTLRRRQQDTLQLRVNGELAARSGLPADLALGVSGRARMTALGANDLNVTQPSIVRGRLAAVVVLKGEVLDEALQELELALCAQLQVCAPAAGGTADAGSGGTDAPSDVARTPGVRPPLRPPDAGR